MNDIIHYAETVLESFEERPFSDVDSLVLSCLAFVDIPETLSDAHQWRGVAIRDLFRAEHFDKLFSVTFAPDHTKRLLTALAASPRFREVKVMDYVSKLDPALEKQFSAMTFRLRPRLSYIAFRGTDSTVVGWKEDFNMAFRSPVPSQEEAVRYLTKAGRHCPGNILLGGHSKGGNLAVYAAAFCRESLQLRIKQVYSHDGPGFLPQVLESPGFARILPRVEKTLPQSSVVGLLLEHQEALKIVKSRSVSVLQHDPFNWVVEDGAFVVLEGLTREARHLDRTISAWLLTQDNTQREKLVDALFDILETTDVRTFSEFRTDWQKHLPTVAREVRHLDADTRTMLFQALKELAALSFKTLPQTLKEKE